jgi:hypothetical protein
MKRARVLLLACLVAALTAGAVWWAGRRSGYATPGECLDAYYDARSAGDTARFLGCLAEPLRTETRRRFGGDADLARALRSGAADLKNRVQQGDATADGADRIVDIEEVRTPGIRRVRFRLQSAGGAWLIGAIDTGPETPADVPYGTHISKGP